MKRNILYAVVFLMLCGCTKEKPPGEVIVNPGNGMPIPVTYGVTRALGENAPPPPADSLVFTFISYSNQISSDYNNVNNYYPNPTANSGTTRYQGFYRYMPREDDWKWQGVMQPCNIITSPQNPKDSRWYSWTRDPLQGQALSNARYMTVCMHPAVELYNNGAGSLRILMTRTDERYVSRPFPLYVQGYEIFPLPEPYDDGYTIPMQDLRSKVWFEIVQGTNSPFEIVDPKLMNAGFWGWYHPLLQTIQVSYEKGTRYDDEDDPNDEYPNTTEFHEETLDLPGDDSAATDPKTGRFSIYDKEDPYYQNTFSEETIPIVAGNATDPGNEELPDTLFGPKIFANPADGNGEVIYETGRGFDQGIFFFSNDYRSRDDYLQPGIYFKLRMGSGGSAGEFKINIPFDIDMKPNHAYLFRLTVESLVIRVHYSAAPWNGTEYPNGGGMGNDPHNWTLLGTWTPAGWEDHDMNGGNYDVG